MCNLVSLFNGKSTFVYMSVFTIGVSIFSEIIYLFFLNLNTNPFPGNSISQNDIMIEHDYEMYFPFHSSSE